MNEKTILVIKNIQTKTDDNTYPKITQANVRNLIEKERINEFKNEDGYLCVYEEDIKNLPKIRRGRPTKKKYEKIGE